MTALVAEVVPPELSSLAHGIHDPIRSLTLLLAIVIAGALRQDFGSEATFLASGVFALPGAFVLLPLRNRLSEPSLGQLPAAVSGAVADTPMVP
jgi:hypothetical protein